MLLAVVDIVNMSSVLFIAGQSEASLAIAAYGGAVDRGGRTFELKGLVSRKKDFIPPLTRAFKEGWKPHSKIREEGAFRRSSHIVMSYTGFAPGRLERIFDDIDEGEGEED